MGCPKYLLSKLQKVHNNATRLIFKHPNLPTSHLMTYASCSGYLLSRELNTSCQPFRTFHLYAPSRQLCSSADTILPNKVQWSALFLLPGSSYLEPAPCFCLSFYLCHFFQIFLENLSLLKSHFFSPIVLTYDCVCVCMCVFVLYAFNFGNMCV